MALITANVGDTEYTECTFDDSCSALDAIRWLADKYGVANHQVSIGQLMTHMAVMASLNMLGGYATDMPTTTPSDLYDSTRDEMTSMVIVHSVD